MPKLVEMFCTFVRTNEDNWYNFILSKNTGTRFVPPKPLGQEFSKFTAMMQILSILDMRVFGIGNAHRGEFSAPRLKITPPEEMRVSIWQHPHMRLDENGVPAVDRESRLGMYPTPPECDHTVTIEMEYVLSFPHSFDGRVGWSTGNFFRVVQELINIIHISNEYGNPTNIMGNSYREMDEAVLEEQLKELKLHVGTTIRIPMSGRTEVKITPTETPDKIELRIELVMHAVPYLMDTDSYNVSSILIAFTSTAVNIEQYVSKLGDSISSDFSLFLK